MVAERTDLERDEGVPEGGEGRGRRRCGERQADGLVQPRPAPFGRRVELVQERVVDHPDDGNLVVRDTDRGAAEREAMDKVGRAVDRVDDPRQLVLRAWNLTGQRRTLIPSNSTESYSR